MLSVAWRLGVLRGSSGTSFATRNFSFVCELLLQPHSTFLLHVSRTARFAFVPRVADLSMSGVVYGVEGLVSVFVSVWLMVVGFFMRVVSLEAFGTEWFPLLTGSQAWVVSMVVSI